MRTDMHWVQYSEKMTPTSFDFQKNNSIFFFNTNITTFSSPIEESSPKNSSTIDEDSDEILDDYIFDRTDIRAIFITLYTIVFCCCFFGNLLVILVVTLSRRLRSITNFFLANLALADLCVGLFCVFQNLSIYLIPSWIFGDFLCKMYMFIHSLSYTASIFILVVICTERYFAIIHPITCKQILTPKRLRLAIVGVWITSAIYSAPKFIWVETTINTLGDGQEEVICINHRRKYNAELFDVINFGLLYVIPLCVMTVLYTRIAVGLWRSTKGIERRVVHQNSGADSGNRCGSTNCSTHCATADVQVSVDVSNNYSPLITTWTTRNVHNIDSHFSHLSQKVLRARRGVIRMLIVVVLTFALCNLPFHARKMWQHWSSNYHGDSNFSTLLTPLTFLISYFNSGINPFLYAFLSRNFRKGMRELLFCSCKRSQKHQQGHLMYAHQSSNNQHHSMLRRSSTRSTRAPCSTATVATNVTDT